MTIRKSLCVLCVIFFFLGVIACSQNEKSKKKVADFTKSGGLFSGDYFGRALSIL